MEPVAALRAVFFISLIVPSSFTRTGLFAAIAPSAVAVISGAADKAEPLTLIAPVTFIPPEVVSNFLNYCDINLWLHH